VATTPSDVHPAQAFFGLPRRIRLNFELNPDGRPCDLLGHVDDVIVTRYATRPWGTNYTAWSRGHPLSPYYKQRASDAEFLPLHLKSSRVGYRDFLGIAVATADGLRLPARCIDAFFKHAENFEGAEKRALLDSRILAAGYAMDNMKPLDFAEGFVPLLLTGNAEGDAHLKDAARRFVTAAILVANQLVKAVKQGLYGSRNQTKWDVTVLDAVRQRFWIDTEQPFYRTLRRMTQALVDPEGRLSEQPAEAKQTISQAWLHVLRTRSLAIFDDTVPVENAESGRIKDVIDGRKLLGVALEGYGPIGIKLFVELNQPERQIKARKGKRAA
jgi:CRISPR system Cascade subunit CasA